MVEDASFSFGYWVRRRRLALDLTQAALGRQTGASAAMIRKIEADERRPSRELAEMLATTFALAGAEREHFLRAARQPAAVDDLPATTTPVAPPAPASPATPPTNLPAPLTSFVDRTHDLPAVTGLLRRPDVRLLTLIGPPGIGKTRLSIRAAETLLDDFPDGVWFVDLAPVTDPMLVSAIIARQVGVHDLADTPLVQQVRAVLRDQRVLLVLDNCEQVAAAAPAISELLRGCKGLKVLATSRVPLHLYGEHEYAAPPLSTPPDGTPVDQLTAYEAIALFLARVRQHQPAFAIDGANAGHLREILRKLQGIPLAIELAAATLRRMSPAELAAALRMESNWVSTIQTDARDLPARQRTLAGAIAWSYDLLDPACQLCLRRLAVFAGTFTTAAAIAVCASADAGDKVVAWLETLADHSLLAREPGRWRMLEMIREFAQGQLDAEELRLARERHAEYYRTLAPRAVADPSAMVPDYHNYVAALLWLVAQGDAAAAVNMSATLTWFWETQGYLQEGQALVSRVLALPGPVDPAQRVNLLNLASTLFWQRHDFARATEYAEQAIAVAADHGMTGVQASLFNLLGRIGIEQGALDRAEEALQRSLDLARHFPQALNPGFPALQLGEVAWASGDLSTAARWFDEADALLPNDRGELTRAILHTNRAELALARGDVTTAQHELEAAIPHVQIHVRRLRYWLVTLAGFLLADGAPLRAPVAALACLAAEHGLGRHGGPLSPMYQALLVERLADARTQTVPAEGVACWQASQQWTAAQTLAYGRSLLLADVVTDPFAQP